MTPDIMPFVHVQGTWGEMGVQVGRMFAPLTVGDLQNFYRDHVNAPHSLCAHPFPGRNVQTVASLIGDLTSRELHLANGSPCRSAHATYTLAMCRQGSLSVEVRDRYLDG